MSELTTRLGLSKPADSDTDWGDEIRGALDIIDKALISHYFGENAASHSGLNFAYLGGVYRNNTTIATIAAGSIALTDNATNYIFVDVSAGAIAANTTGFASGDIPLFTVITAAGAITNVTDNRTLLSADVTLAHNHDASYAALGHDHNLEYASASHDHDTYYYTETELGGVADGTAGADLIGATPITSLGEANTVQGILEALAAAGGSGGTERGIAFYIDGELEVGTDVVSFIAPCALTVTGGKLEVSTAPTGADLVCDVLKNGVSMYTTQSNRPTIAAGNTSASIIVPDVTTIAQWDRITLQIDVVGSTVTGANLSLTLGCTEVVVWL